MKVKQRKTEYNMNLTSSNKYENCKYLLKNSALLLITSTGYLNSKQILMCSPTLLTLHLVLCCRSIFF